MDSKIIEIKGLEKKYNSKFSLSVDDLYLKNNKILTIIGPNGSGKSTLIRLLNLLEKPDRGAISFEGENILDERVDKFAIRKKMVVVFQEPLLFNTSVYSNIIIGLKFRKIRLSTVRDRFEYFTEKLKIGDILGRSIKNLIRYRCHHKISQYNFGKKSEQEEVNSPGDFMCLNFRWLVALRQEISCTNNRPCYQLREKRYIE